MARQEVEELLARVPDGALVEWVRGQGMFAANRSQAIGIIAQAFRDRVDEILAAASASTAAVAEAVDAAATDQATADAEADAAAASTAARAEAAAEAVDASVDAAMAAEGDAHVDARVDAAVDARVDAAVAVTVEDGAASSVDAPSTEAADAPSAADAVRAAQKSPLGPQLEGECLRVVLYGEPTLTLQVPLARLQPLPFAPGLGEDPQLADFLDRRLAFWQEHAGQAEGEEEAPGDSLTFYLHPEAASRLSALRRELGLAQYQVVALALEVMVWLLAAGRPLPVGRAPGQVERRASVGRFRVRQRPSHGLRKTLRMPAPVTALAHALGDATGTSASEVISLALLVLAYCAGAEPA